MSKHLRLFRDVLFENYPSLEFHSDLVYCQMFRMVVKFCKACFVIFIVCYGCHPSCQLHSCYCPRSAETEGCDSIVSEISFVRRMDSEAAPISSNSPPVCLELYDPFEISQPKTQHFHFNHIRLGTSPSSNKCKYSWSYRLVSTASKIMISEKNSSRTLSGVDPSVMCADPLLFPLRVHGGCVHCVDCGC